MFVTNGVRALAVASAIALSGCSILNPYVRAPQLDAKASGQGTDFTRIENVIEAAEAQRVKYYAAVSERAKLRNSLPLVLLPLSSIALYRGITTSTDAGRRNVLQLGILGAAFYGTGSFYLAAPRERLYLAGVAALNCAIHAVEPLLVGKTGYAQFAADLPQMDAALGQVEFVQRELEGLAARATPGSTTAMLAQAQARAAEALVARAREISTAAHTLDGRINNAGPDLRSVLQNIVVQVDRQIEATEQDPAAVLRAVGGLAGIGANLAHVSALQIGEVGKASVSRAGEDKAQSKEDPVAGEIDRALGRLKTAGDTLQDKMFKVAAYTAKVTDTVKNTTRLEGCTVEDVASEMAISPAGDSFTLKTGIAQVFRVRGNSGVPGAALVGAVPDANALEVTNSVEGNVLVVRALQKSAVTRPDQVTLEFTANERTNSARRQVTLRLDPNDAPKSGAAAAAGKKDETQTPAKPAARHIAPDDAKIGPSGGDPKSEYETKVLTVGKLKEIQKKLGVFVDGFFGPQTREAIKQHEDSDAPTGVLTPELAEKILNG